MAGHPDAAVLIEAVRGFIAGLDLDGRDAFHAKVAANALAIVARDLAAGPDASEEAALGMTPAEMCARLRDGRASLETSGLIDALIAAAVVRLAVDNPRYATLSRLTADAALR